MTTWARAWTIAAAVGLLWSGAALAADTKAMDCDKSKTPPVLAGTVTRIDQAKSTVTLKETNGTMHEFQVSKETLQDLKVGDSLEGALRANPNCK